LDGRGLKFDMTYEFQYLQLLLHVSRARPSLPRRFPAAKNRDAGTAYARRRRAAIQSRAMLKIPQDFGS
jgi:hypothetical protein